MTHPALSNFKQQALSEGYQEVVERNWEPNTVAATHTHPFAARGLVTQGEMWLSCDGHTQHLLPGDIFSLEPNTPHEEIYGPEGATYWAARRS
jgi:quercetin dioxygenase-like cupin family protein